MIRNANTMTIFSPSNSLKSSISHNLSTSTSRNPYQNSSPPYPLSSQSPTYRLKIYYFDNHRQLAQVERWNHVAYSTDFDNLNFNWDIINSIMRPDELAVDYLDSENEWVRFSGAIEEFEDIKREIYALDVAMRRIRDEAYTFKLRVRPKDIRLPLREQTKDQKL